jgi:threonine dehydrogenase-like Zn-dependent dehydrogenase
VAGGAAEYVAVPAANCVRLPEHVATADATLIEPLSCAVRGYDVLSSQLGSHVLIYGAGTMGLMMLQLAHRVGAASVDVIDVNPARLAVARRVGLTNAASSAAELEPPFGWDLVVDATGNLNAIQDGLGRVGAGGTFLQFGVSDYAARATIEPYRIYNKEITITGSMAVLHSFERAAELFAAGVLDPSIFITDRFPLDRYGDAIAAFRGGAGLKTQVLPGNAVLPGDVVVPSSAVLPQE